MEGEQVAINDEDQAAMDAAFLAEMTSDDSHDDATEQLAAPVVEEKQAEVEVIEDARNEVFAGYTEAELKESLSQVGKLQKALDTTNGTYGKRLDEQQRVIEELKQQRNSTVGALSKDKLVRLSQEFPEIAEMLAADLNDYVGQGAQSSFDPSQIEQSMAEKFKDVEDRLTKKEQELELRTLNRQHKDWKEVAAFSSLEDGSIAWSNPQFGNFVAKLPADEQQQLINGWDADFIAEKLTQFKATIKPSIVKKKSIEAAILPRGVGGKSTSSPEDEEAAAMRAEMARA